jgi:hypothetical protein
MLEPPKNTVPQARESLLRELERLSPTTAQYLLDRIDRLIRAQIDDSLYRFAVGIRRACEDDKQANTGRQPSTS